MLLRLEIGAGGCNGCLYSWKRKPVLPSSFLQLLIIILYHDFLVVYK